jgi:VCBS repeat-containing protein
MDRMVSVNSSANEATVSHNEQDAGHSAVQAQNAAVAAAQPNAQQAHAAPSQSARSVPTEAELAAAKVAAANAVAESEEVLAQLVEDAEKDKEELRLAVADEAEAEKVETAEFTATSPAIDLTSGLTTVQFAQAGMPARQGVDGASSLGQDDDDDDAGVSGVLIGVLALAAIGGGIAVAAGGGNKESDLPSNRPPVAGDDALTATEGAGTVNLSVTANDSDPDGNTLTYTANGALPVGVTLSAAGAVTFDSNNAEYNILAAGATRALTFSYTVNDGNGGTDTASVTLTVTGTNDAPVAVADTAAATEDAPAVTGSVATNDSDVDTGAVLTYALAAPVAGLTLNSNGSYSFDPANAAYQPLAAGATRVVVANYTVSDANGGSATSTLTITVTGTNDAPVAVADVATATEDGAAVTGSVATNDSDVDTGTTLTYALTGTAPAGLTLNANGTYSFDPSNAAYQALAAGQTQVVVANYTVSDGNGGTATSTLTITVTGTNDVPVAVADVAAATEDGAVVTGSMRTNDSDVDATDVLTYALNAPVAGLTLNANGTYSFDPSNAAYQQLAAGQTQVVTANITVSDGNGGSVPTTLTITVTGTNDVPVAVADVAAATEDGAVVTGSMRTNDSDVDTTDVLTYTLNAPVAGLTLNANGTYSFDPSNAAYQQLAAGQTQVVTANITVNDGNGGVVPTTLTITVTGTNDVPVAVADVAAATEDGAVVTGSMRTNDSDVDTTDVLTYTLNAPVAGLTLNANGTYSFDPSNAAYQQLAAGQTQVVTANITVNDGNGGVVPTTLTITVTGTNDVPVAVADVAAATEDGAVVTGSMRTNDSDVDTTDVLTYTLNAPVAGLTLNANGTYSFDPSNAAYQQLAAGQTQVVTANITVNDGNGGVVPTTLTITVTGTNDVPVAVADVAAATEDGAVVTGSMRTNDSDVDTTDVLTYTLNAPVAGLTLNADGTYSFAPSNAAYQQLAAGQTQVVTANITVNDGNGGVVPTTLTITVTGTNDVPVAVADVAAATEDGAVVTGSMRTNDSDVDTTDVLTYTLNAPVAGLTLNANGTYSFDPSNAAYQTLRSGATQVVTANITVSDGNGGVVPTTLTITVTGTNDAPVITSPTTGLVSENAPNTTVVYDANATDIDAGDVLSYSISGADAAAFNINATTGEVRLNAPANFERQTSYSITVTATDNGTPALSATRAVTIAVANEIDVLSIDNLGATGAPVVVNAGIQAGDVTDTNFQFTETSGGFTEVNIVDFSGNDFIFFGGFDPSDYTFQDDGNGNLVISRLDDDGFTTNLITLVDVLDGLTLAPIVTEADAEAALALAFGAGDYFRGSAAPADIATTGVATFNAAGVQASFIEDLDAPESFIIIQNFRADDRIIFIDGDIGEVSFGTDPNDARDLRIEYFDFTTGQASTIILDDVLDPNGPIVFDEASAEAAIGAIIGAGDYFQVG